MKQNPRSKANQKKTKTVLSLPDLECAKATALISLTQHGRGGATRLLPQAPMAHRRLAHGITESTPIISCTRRQPSWLTK